MANIRKSPREQHPEDNWVWSPQGVIDMHRQSGGDTSNFSTAEPGKAGRSNRSDARGARCADGRLLRPAGNSSRYRKYAAALAELHLPASAGTGEFIAAREWIRASARIGLPDCSSSELHVTEDSNISAVMAAGTVHPNKTGTIQGMLRCFLPKTASLTDSQCNTTSAPTPCIHRDASGRQMKAAGAGRPITFFCIRIGC